MAWEEALLALEDSLPALAGADAEADEEAEERKRKRWGRRLSLKARPNRQTGGKPRAFQLAAEGRAAQLGRHPPRRRRSASTCGCSMERPA